jgi:hypothetical protein
MRQRKMFQQRINARILRNRMNAQAADAQPVHCHCERRHDAADFCHMGDEPGTGDFARR